MYLCVIFGFVISAVILFFLPETYGPVILTQKAKKLRFETKNWAIRSKQDEEPLDLIGIAKAYLIRPWGQSSPFLPTEIH